jgi:hypothetical protein
MRLAVSLPALLALAAPAFAQSTTETVTFSLQAAQPSLFDSDLNDTFTGTVDDRMATTTFEVVCSAGASAWLGLSRVDEACSVAGNGLIKNPNNPAQTLPRVQFSGGFTIVADQDGYTDATTILANYLRAGAAGAESTSFRGHLMMQPEDPSESALALSQRLIQNLQETAAGGDQVEYSSEIDSIRFENFVVPHMGHQGSEACSWTGDAIFAYANNAWQMQFDVRCGADSYRLEGNMPLLDAGGGKDYQQEYNLNLVLPGAGGGDPFAAADPFATIDGITGQLRIANGGRSTEDGVYESVTVTGELIGTGVPLELVRGYGQIMIVLGRTFFGA